MNEATTKEKTTTKAPDLSSHQPATGAWLHDSDILIMMPGNDFIFGSGSSYGESRHITLPSLLIADILSLALDITEPEVKRLHFTPESKNLNYQREQLSYQDYEIELNASVLGDEAGPVQQIQARIDGPQMLDLLIQREWVGGDGPELIWDHITYHGRFSIAWASL